MAIQAGTQKTAKIKVESEKFCVYVHRSDGEIFYIGMGSASRAFEKAGRTSIWKAIVAKAGKYDVEILAWFDSEDLASKEEKRLIQENKPIANAQHKEPSSKKPKRTKSALLVFRVTDSDRDMIRKMADKAGLGITDFVLSRVWGEAEPQPTASRDGVAATPQPTVKCPRCDGRRGWEDVEAGGWADCDMCGGTGKI